jgi:hypothetical protein
MTTERDLDFFFTHMENQDAIVVVHPILANHSIPSLSYDAFVQVFSRRPVDFHFSCQYLINRKTP